jgi:hypothetical protein
VRNIKGIFRGADNHSPTRQLQNSGLVSKNTNPLANLAKVFFSCLTDNFYILGQLFSDLVSKIFELLASLVSVLKKIIRTPGILLDLT